MTSEVDENTVKEFNDWANGRPEVIKKMAETLKPWNTFRLKPTGQHCTLYSYDEDGTVTVDIIGHDNEALAVMNKIIPVRVFGITLNDLTELE